MSQYEIGDNKKLKIRKPESKNGIMEGILLLAMTKIKVII